MNCFILILPVFLFRYVLVACINKAKLHDLNFFPPGNRLEETARKTYLLFNTALLFIPVFLDMKRGIIPSVGIMLYGISLIIYILSILSFCLSHGLVHKGLYLYSRNPQALSFIILYFSITLISKTWIYGLMLLPLVWSFKMISLSEERWCKNKFGYQWEEYFRSTKRFI